MSARTTRTTGTTRAGVCVTLTAERASDGLMPDGRPGVFVRVGRSASGVAGSGSLKSLGWFALERFGLDPLTPSGAVKAAALRLALGVTA